MGIRRVWGISGGVILCERGSRISLLIKVWARDDRGWEWLGDPTVLTDVGSVCGGLVRSERPSKWGELAVLGQLSLGKEKEGLETALIPRGGMIQIAAFVLTRA